MPRKKMWFGTQHHAEWVDCPLRGAEMSPEGWGTEGTYLSGGGFVRQSQDSHRQYIFEWSGASSREAAERVQAYRDGVYNKSRMDLIYFHDPLTYDRNILPKRWAQPGLGVVENSIAYGTHGTLIRAETPPEMVDKGVPFVGAHIESPITSAASVDSPRKGVLWIPLPEDMTLRITAWTGNDSGSSNGLYYRRVDLDGDLLAATKISSDATSIRNITHAKGVFLYTAGTPAVYGMRAILTRGSSGIPANWGSSPEWSTGLGHSGCRFVGNPTWAATSGVGGGQIGYAATLKEVGDWQ